MTPKEISTKTKKVINMHKDIYIINQAYLNPMYASELYKQVPELEKAGIKVSTTETETKNGSTIEAVMFSKARKMSLGSVLLDGENVVVEKDLSSINGVIKFIEVEAEDIAQQSVEQKEQQKIIDQEKPAE